MDAGAPLRILRQLIGKLADVVADKAIYRIRFKHDVEDHIRLIGARQIFHIGEIQRIFISADTFRISQKAD
jgi:hypothetical protein